MLLTKYKKISSSWLCIYLEGVFLICGLAKGTAKNTSIILYQKILKI